MIIFLQGWERNIVLDRLREEIVSQRERERDGLCSGRERERTRSGVPNWRLSRFLPRSPSRPEAQGLSGLFFSPIPPIYIHLPRRSAFSRSFHPSSTARFTGARTPPPSLPPVRLVPLPVEERSFEGRARRMQKRERREKKRWVEGTERRWRAGGRGGRGEGGGDGGDGWGEARGEGGGPRDAQSRINAASLRSRSESRSEQRCIFWGGTTALFSLDNRTLYGRHYRRRPTFLPSSLRYLFVITLELFHAGTLVYLGYLVPTVGGRRTLVVHGETSNFTPKQYVINFFYCFASLAIPLRLFANCLYSVSIDDEARLKFRVPTTYTCVQLTK